MERIRQPVFSRPHERQGGFKILMRSSRKGRTCAIQTRITAAFCSVIRPQAEEEAASNRTVITATLSSALTTLEALRGIAVGRKSWLFAGSDRGGQRAAIMYSLIYTAKLNKVDPQAWLADVLARIADHPAKRIEELLPWNWKPPERPPQT